MCVWLVGCVRACVSSCRSFLIKGLSSCPPSLSSCLSPVPPLVCGLADVSCIRHGALTQKHLIHNAHLLYNLIHHSLTHLTLGKVCLSVCVCLCVCVYFQMMCPGLEDVLLTCLEWSLTVFISLSCYIAVSVHLSLFLCLRSTNWTHAVTQTQYDVHVCVRVYTMWSQSQF